MAGIFLFLAYYLYQQQVNKYSFLSFKLENPEVSIVIPDLDRLLKKIEDANEIESIEINNFVENGMNALISNKNISYDSYFGKKCFISFNQSDLTIAFKSNTISLKEISNLITTKLGGVSTYTDNGISINNKEYHFSQFGAYSVFSTIQIKPVFETNSFIESNADYYMFKKGDFFERYILANNKQFKVWNEEAEPVRGEPIKHSSFIQKIPQSFTEVYFYGSQRMDEDKNTFFLQPNEEAFSWVDNGLMILKKDSFELMIASQNTQRNLDLLLEEQTLNAVGDSVQINYLSVKNFKIMPFTSTYNWQNSIPELKKELNYYTEFENFNVLANSLEAMHWYLSEIQTGNLVEGNEKIMRHYSLSTPLKCHYVALTNTGNEIKFETHTWISKTKRTKTVTTVLLNETVEAGNSAGLEFSVLIKPDFILPFSQNGEQNILTSNAKSIAVYNAEGNLTWKIELANKLLLKPQLIDLEKDGIFEFVLFTENEFLVLNSNGVKIQGLSQTINQAIIGGLCVNYDNKYDYRFFIVTKTGVICLNEKGAVVEGWQFTNTATPLSGEAYYTQINGTDFLTFKAENKQVFVLNRKGENKFGSEIVSKLSNESEFVIGKNESLIHKLGYANQYIYNRFLKDNYTDSVKLDIRVNAISANWVLIEQPILVIEEPNRILLVNKFGYVEQEILKPQMATKFLGVLASAEIYYVFFNNANNSLYLLNKNGKLVLSNLANNTQVFGISTTSFYTFDGQKIKEHKLN